MATDDEWFDDDAGPVVRPYAVTGGRTRPDEEFEMVALVSTTPRGSALAASLEREQRTIAFLCIELQSIAEISAQLDLPLGVTRVLVGDMVEQGLVTVHRPESPRERPDASLMEKVLDGLQAL